MDLYRLNKTRLEEVRHVPFKLEKDIQTLVEDNVSVLFGLEFVQTEFALGNLRIDTLAFDEQSKSFVIIEYKKGKSYSVIDQGYSYLSLLLNNKADFILEYLERTGKSLKKDDVDWSQSRVIFISPQFTTYQRQSIEFKDLPFELWEIRRYSNDTIVLNQHKSSSQESVKGIGVKDEKAERVDKEVVVYTEADHVANGTPDVQELYEDMKERLLAHGDLELKPLKHWINFKLNRKILWSVAIQKNQLKVWVNLKSGQMEDPKEMFEDVSKKGHWGIGDYEAKITPESDLDYLMSVVRQSYQFHGGD